MAIKRYCLMILLSLCVAAAQAQYDSAIIRKQQALAGSVKQVNNKATVATTKVKKLNAQADSLLASIQAVPAKYITKIDDKIEKYSDRITSKTEKTLAKLSKWEGKIKGLLEQVSPETAQKLFSAGQMTFSTVLKKIQDGKTVAEGYKAKYNAYRDQLTTSLNYLQEQKDKLNKQLAGPLNKATEELAELEKNMANAEAVEIFIKERKRQLIDESMKYIGKSKYLKKINKEAYYYVETLKNYKEIFSSPKKTEETALALLNKIPAFQRFVQQNSQLAGLFASPLGFGSLGGGGGSVPIVNGLASRASLQQFVNTTGSNPVQQIQQQIIDGGSPLNEWKSKLNSQGKSGDEKLPDFTPNTQKTKSFRERLEVGTDLQFGKGVSYLPATSDIGFKLGYKFSDKSSAGIGVNYKLGLGSISNIRVSSQGLGLRTYLKWKLKKGFDVQGGGEWNYMMGFKKIEQLKLADLWQKSALLGISKNYKIGKKVKGNSQVLYDFLHNTHYPRTPAFIFRLGYGF